ncbi:phosphotriesterase family protein [Foetidibacter luteolus]|uniref:phosphotriesterase family protein n=1 Tax=Foetidibacter luteolus TaxID=2608880 RepID=UPI00129AB5F7|nr:phosphotriesterase [Foetidibacter luteolus]
MYHRRKFIQSLAALTVLPAFAKAAQQPKASLLSVTGWVKPGTTGYILPHEHVLVDFIGAEKITKDRYNTEEVVKAALPRLMELKQQGCTTMLECTPAYIGRNAALLQRLSKETGLTILTNTGYYGAAGEKYYPAHAYTETAGQLAQRWITEFEQGIDGTGIKPGFIKLGADKAPITETQRKTVHAAALTHLKTGLKIGMHTGDGPAAEQELAILLEHGVAAENFIWIHAQNEKDFSFYKRLASQGCWIEFDGIGNTTLTENLQRLQYMQSEKLLHKVLLSQDSGWYHVGEAGGGSYNGYTSIFTHFLPLLRSNNFKEAEIDMLMKENPVKAYGMAG